MMVRAVFPTLIAGCLAASALVAAQAAKPPVNRAPMPPVDVSAKNAEAVFKKYCGLCHGPSGAMKAKFSTDWATMMRQKAVVAGKPDKSKALQLMKSATKPMPPQGIQPRPTAADIEAVRVWISRGAKKF